LFLILYIYSLTPDIEKAGNRKGMVFTRVSPEPSDPAPDCTDPVAMKFKDRYCQVLEGKATNPGGVGKHGEPQADHDVTVLYMPCLSNEKEPAVKPSEVTFVQVIYTAEEVDDLARVTKANFEEELDKIRATIKGVWEKKKMARLASTTMEK
jgi:hypothetical protein